MSDYGNNAIRKITQLDPFPGFKVTNVIPNGHGGIAVSWSTKAGFHYQLQSSADLTTWQNIGAVITGDGTTKTVNDDTLSGTPRRFYRATVVTP